MNHKTNTLKNILQKNANFLPFVWKNIVSLQVEDKSSVFSYKFLLMKSEKFQKGTGTKTFVIMRTNLFVPMVFLRTS